MLRTLEQFLCRHEEIKVTTETDLNSSLLIIKSLIQCQQCKKSFPLLNNGIKCCYVEHVHADILKEQFIRQFKMPMECNQHHSTR